MLTLYCKNVVKRYIFVFLIFCFIIINPCTINKCTRVNYFIMIREIYCKLPSDLDYKLQVESMNAATNLLQQIKVVLGTKPGEVLGAPMFGVNLEKYLFLMNYNKDEIKQMIIYEISQHVVYDPNLFTLSIDISFGHNANDAYEYALIDIVINEQKCMGIIVNQ